MIVWIPEWFRCIFGNVLDTNDLSSEHDRCAHNDLRLFLRGLDRARDDGFSLRAFAQTGGLLILIGSVAGV
jgi:hypothetical protein